MKDDDNEDTEVLTLNDDAPAKPNPSGEDRGDVVATEKVEAADDSLDLESVKKVAAEKIDDDEPPPDKPMPANIPKARFDEVNTQLQREREQNERLLALLAQRQPEAKPAEQAKPPVDVDELETAYANALLDGKTDDAMKLRRQINNELIQQATQAATQQVSQRTTEQLFSEEVVAIIKRFPQLDAKNEQADQDAIAAVVDWRDFLVAQRGVPLHTALRQAADRVAKDQGWINSTPAAAPSAAPNDERLVQARVRNAKAAQAQAPALDAGVGERAATVMDVSKMTEAQFRSLPEAERKRLRGD